MKTSSKEILNYIKCPFAVFVVQIVLIAVIWFNLPIFPFYKKYSTPKFESKIKKEMQKIVNQCGKGYYISWIEYDNRIFRDRYFFKDVIGDNLDHHLPDLINSIKDKELNSFYSKPHEVDYKTFDYIDQLDTGDVRSFKDIKDLKDLPSIYNALTNTNKKIYFGGLTVVRDIRIKVIYVFTLVSTGDFNNICDRNSITQYLEEIATITKNNLL
jgi:hypothetical protein